jgi:NTE family protein
MDNAAPIEGRAMTERSTAAAGEDVIDITTPEPAFEELEEQRQWALCLSGGGYRAMLFHVGVLWRLNELGFLPRLDRISSVSGGSITAAALGLHWHELAFDADGVAVRFDRVVDAVRTVAGETLDASSILSGLFGRGSVGERVAAAYDRHLCHGATLQALPERPRFVINATNVQSGALWRFSRPYMGDYRVGRVHSPDFPLAMAVAASSAFPPFLSPLEIELDAGAVVADPGSDLSHPPFTRKVVLSDGGVYDNLGLETAWKTHVNVLVSDGGGKMQPEEDPHGDWARHSLRINSVIDNQVRSLRKRQLIDSFKDGVKGGAYWGIRTHIADYGLTDTLPAPADKTLALAETPTRLEEVPAVLQERLINWGYAVTDAAMRRHVLDPAPPAPQEFPYRNVGVG